MATTKHGPRQLRRNSRTLRALRLLVAVNLWLVAATCWLAYAAIVGLWTFGDKRSRLVDSVPDWRWLGKAWRWLAGTPRRKAIGPAAGDPKRMSGFQVGEARYALGRRDGWWCQNCHVDLSPRLHWRHPQFPHVHHLASWSRHKHLWWVDALWNLCLLCPPCNLSIGAGTTPVLERLRQRLIDEAVAAGEITVEAA